VGALSEPKGVLLLVDAIAALRAQRLDVQLDLVGACDSPAFEKQLHDRLAAPELAGSVVLRGVLTGHPKWQMYAAADMHCFPSHYPAETFGLAVLEAMQFELPVVATDFRSMPAIVTHGESGLLVPPNDPAALAAALAELCRDPQRRLALGRKARQRYLELFAQDRFTRGITAALVSM
jgi:glycosyltransferase involved in cell wall biosynthesis